MKRSDPIFLRRRSWLAFVGLSALLSACGGGDGGDGQWDTAMAWDQTTWN
jgi:hypothetical protein